MRSLGGYYSSFGDEIQKDMAEQARKSVDRRSEPADIGLFVGAITQQLREKQSIYDALIGRHKSIKNNFDKAKVGILKLTSLPVKYQFRLQKVKEDLQNIVNDNKGVGYVLNRCKKILDETSTTAQFVGEGLKPIIGDKHKKIGYQKEVAIRLRDVDSQFDRCKDALLKEEEDQKRLLHEIQSLLAESGKMLAPKAKKDLDHKGKVWQMVLEEQTRMREAQDKKVKKPKKKEKPVKQKIPKVPAISGVGLSFGDEAEPGFFDSAVGKVSLVLLGAAATTAALKIFKG